VGRLERAITPDNSSPQSLPAIITKRDIISRSGAPPVPEVMMVILLDEIAGRLAEIRENTVAEGRVVPATISVTDMPVKDKLEKWFSVSYVNDGPDPAYILSSGVKPSLLDAPLKIGDQINVQRKQKAEEQEVWLSCLAGQSASCRRWALY